MTAPFDRNESGYTATALNLVESPGEALNYDFDVIDLPVRQKINNILSTTNRIQYRRRGVH
jgi:hypothetical protein